MANAFQRYIEKGLRSGLQRNFELLAKVESESSNMFTCSEKGALRAIGRKLTESFRKLIAAVRANEPTRFADLVKTHDRLLEEWNKFCEDGVPPKKSHLRLVKAIGE